MTFYPRYDISVGPSIRRERFRKKVTSPNTLQIDPGQWVKLTRDYYPCPASLISTFAESAKLEATRMIERKGERLYWGFNVKSLYKKVPRRRSTYVKFQSKTWHINPRATDANLTSAIPSEKNTPLVTITFQVNKSIRYCTCYWWSRSLYSSFLIVIAN